VGTSQASPSKISTVSAALNGVENRLTRIQAIGEAEAGRASTMV
jgi:hypothetical protein